MSRLRSLVRFVAGEVTQFRERLAGHDLLRESIVEVGQGLAFQLADLDGVVELLALERLDGEILRHVQAEVARLARRRAE